MNLNNVAEPPTDGQEEFDLVIQIMRQAVQRWLKLIKFGHHYRKVIEV